MGERKDHHRDKWVNKGTAHSLKIAKASRGGWDREEKSRDQKGDRATQGDGARSTQANMRAHTVAITQGERTSGTPEPNKKTAHTGPEGPTWTVL